MSEGGMLLPSPKPECREYGKNRTVPIWEASISSLLIFWLIAILRIYFDNILLKCFLDPLPINFILNEMMLYMCNSKFKILVIDSDISEQLWVNAEGNCVNCLLWAVGRTNPLCSYSLVFIYGNLESLSRLWELQKVKILFITSLTYSLPFHCISYRHWWCKSNGG